MRKFTLLLTVIFALGIFTNKAYGETKPQNLAAGLFSFIQQLFSVENTVPAKGAKIGVKGKVQDGVNYNGKNYGLGIREEDRRFADK